MSEEQELQAALRAVGLVELRRDGPHQDAGTLVGSGGERTAVFVRYARTPARFAAELWALQWLEQQLGARAPVPRVVAAVPAVRSGVLILSYEPGANLADFLPSGMPIPALPDSYVRSHPGPAGDLCPALAEAGQAVRLVHGLHLERFGKPVGNEPNPYRDDARRFTAHEAHHLLSLCLEREAFDGATAGRIERWLAQYMPLIDVSDRPCFVHFDLHAANVRLAPRPGAGWRFQTLLDWELARAWLAEYDLALLSWYLPRAWREAFLRGYGPVRGEVIRLFEMIKALDTIACSKRPDDWSVWGRRRAAALLERW